MRMKKLKNHNKKNLNKLRLIERKRKEQNERGKCFHLFPIKLDKNWTGSELKAISKSKKLVVKLNQPRQLM
jgi:hypothetical protein